MGSKIEFDKRVVEDIVEQWMAGDSMDTIGERYNLTRGPIKRVLKESGLDDATRREIRSARKKTVRAMKIAIYSGLTEEQYDRMLEEQGGVCAICKLPCSSGRRLAIDHNHKTLQIRGLLCGNCNFGLGKFRDDPSLLASAIQYLLDDGSCGWCPTMKRPLPDRKGNN